MDIKFEQNGDLFVWDERKAETNWRKHGIRFEEAATVFSDPLFVLVDASRNEEARDAVIGFDEVGRLLYVVQATSKNPNFVAILRCSQKIAPYISNICCVAIFCSRLVLLRILNF